MNLFTFVTYIQWNIKILEQLPEVLISNVSNVKACLLFLVWIFFPDRQKGSHPLTWYFHINTWLWKGDLPLVQTIKLRRYVQDNLLPTIIDLPLFPNIASSTTFHVQWCKIIFPECLLIGSTMINSWWWCYNC